MQWTKASERLPSKHDVVCVRYKSDGKMFYCPSTEWYSLENLDVEWYDETLPCNCGEKDKEIERLKNEVEYLTIEKLGFDELKKEDDEKDKEIEELRKEIDRLNDKLDETSYREGELHNKCGYQRLRISELEEGLKDLIFTASKLWDDTKALQNTDIMKVTHPTIESAKQLLK